jgi:hypothetical protein
LHQQPKHSETIVLGERGQSRHGICLFHASTITEISASVKRHFNEMLSGLKLRSSNVVASH